MNPILIAVPFFFTAIGVEVLIARLRGHAVHRWNDAIGSLALGSINITVNGLARVATYGIYALVWDQGRLFDVPVDEPLAWLAALILYDFLYYWFHRLSHERNILWAAHVVHHSSEEYNLTTALRQTGTGFLLGWIFYLPMAVLGVPPLMFAIVGLIDLLYQFWIHTREIGRLGWFDRVFASPSNHRVHHGQNDYCIDRNYGGILILWDRLFGTFVEERDDEPIVYGIRGAVRSWSPIEANLKTYRDLWRAARAAPDWRAGLSVWFAAPSAPLRAPGHPAFEPHAFTPFDPPESAAQRRQYLFHYGVLFLVSLGFLALPPGRGAVAAWALGALLIAKAALLGRAMMARPVLGADLIWWLAAGLTALGPLAAPPDLVIAAALSGAIASLGFGLAARRAPITP